ncbi:MAG: RNA 2',3'-cyclic phosphodiesterase [Mycobacterium leprae]
MEPGAVPVEAAVAGRPPAMRLFVAVRPPPEALAHLDAAVVSHRDDWLALGWVPAERWHLTLAFLGDVDPDRVDPLAQRLARTAARHPALTLSFAGAGTFPRRHAHARVVWTGVFGDRRELGLLAAGVVAAASRERIAVDDRPYRPHLTLARVRRPADVSPLVAELSSYAGPVWTATDLQLVRSHLGPKPRHETLAHWPLGAG